MPLEDRKVRNPASRDDEDVPTVGAAPAASGDAVVPVSAERADVCSRFDAALGSDPAVASSRTASKCFPNTVCMRTCAAAE